MSSTRTEVDRERRLLAPETPRSHTRRVKTDSRLTFSAAAECFVDLVNRIPANAWPGPGLGEWDVQSLVGHTSRALSTVLSYLPRQTAEQTVDSAAGYFTLAVIGGGADPAAVADRGRAAGAALGPEPGVAVRVMAADATAAVNATTGDPVIETIAGGIRLSEYLRTRAFELTVHTLDIAAATGLSVHPPADALSDAVRLAAELVDPRDDGAAVLLALTGRQPLPDNFSVL